MFAFTEHVVLDGRRLADGARCLPTEVVDYAARRQDAVVTQLVAEESNAFGVVLQVTLVTMKLQVQTVTHESVDYPQVCVPT